jgi:dipeptidyl aminopeptidase/acylaminoacyl peptidase
VGREAGQDLLHYRLVELIGQGGMGSVWRAQDTTLDRDAAIKILPDALALDAQFLARFGREAKLLASLSHPNLAAVFGVHKADSTHFLAMELVPGEDLSQRLERGPLPVDEAVAIMGKIDDGLEAAHAKGVVHRDLKPANVRLTPDGRVKVLDFGLAKSVEGDVSESDTGDVSLTATGVVLGTAPYMSPEQARGQPVDARTDVWSFGCVLWECLTGESPFHRETIPDLVVAILNDEPDWSRLPADTSPSVVRLLRRCLAKSRRERLHHIADARLELDEEGDAPTVMAPAAPEAKRSVYPVLSLVLAVALAASLIVPGSKVAPAPREPVLANASFTKLTDDPGEEIDAAISPDGQFVAFLGDGGGSFEAYVGRIGSETYVNRGPPPYYKLFPPRRIGFQGDGSGLWFSGNSKEKLQRVPLMQGPGTPWLLEFTIHVDWSPKDGRIVFSRGDGGDPVYVADADGRNEKVVKLPTEGGYHQHYPTWSADGKWIYLVRGRIGGLQLWRTRPDGTDLEQLTTADQVRDPRHPTPLDGKTLLFVAREPDGAGPWMWQLDPETRALRRAIRGVERYTSLCASRDGQRLVATVANPQARLYTVPILPAGVATEADVKPHPPERTRALAPRIRGDRLYYLSSIDGTDDLWCRRDGKAGRIWRGPLLEPAAISPDGSRIAIVVRIDSRPRLQVIRADGTEPRPLLDGVDVVGAPCWSPDGEWIVIGAAESGLYKVRLEDGRREHIYLKEATNPVWAGDRIFFAGSQMGPSRLLHAVAPDGRPLDVGRIINVPAAGERIRFLPDGSGLVYLVGWDPHYEFRLLDFATGTDRALTKFSSSARMRTFDITPDRKSIVFGRYFDNADVVLIER